MTGTDRFVSRNEVPASLDLVVPNLADFNLRHPALRVDPATERSFHAYGRAYADQAVFWSVGPRVLILPPGVDRLWLADVHDALGVEVPPVVAPADDSGGLVTNLLYDDHAMAAVRGYLDGARTVRLLSWGATPELYLLAAAVRSWGHEVDLDVPAEARYWTSLYLDAKTSCADLAAQVPGLRVPRGMTVVTWQELSGALDVILAGGCGAIVKSMVGVGGRGSAVVRVDAGSVEQFWRAVRHDAFLRVFPMIVQEHIAHDPGLGCLAVDMLLVEDGTQELVTSVMTPDGHQLLSIDAGSGLVHPALETRLYDLSQRVASVALGLGFRGWLGVDYLAGADGQLYVLELNARRTGGMHGISLLHRWRGSSAVVAQSRDAVSVPAEGPVSWATLRPAFRRLWDAGVRAYPTTVRGLTRARPTIGIVTGAASAAHANDLAGDLCHAIHAAVARTADPGPAP